MSRVVFDLSSLADFNLLYIIVNSKVKFISEESLSFDEDHAKLTLKMQKKRMLLNQIGAIAILIKIL